MSTLEAQLVLLHDDGGEEVNVFIHGYRTTKDFFWTLASAVNKIELPGRVYVLFWPNGNWWTRIVGVCASAIRKNGVGIAASLVVLSVKNTLILLSRKAPLPILATILRGDYARSLIYIHVR